MVLSTSSYCVHVADRVRSELSGRNCRRLGKRRERAARPRLSRVRRSTASLSFMNSQSGCQASLAICIFFTHAAKTQPASQKNRNCMYLRTLGGTWAARKASFKIRNTLHFRSRSSRSQSCVVHNSQSQLYVRCPCSWIEHVQGTPRLIMPCLRLRDSARFTWHRARSWGLNLSFLRELQHSHSHAYGTKLLGYF